MLNKKSRFQACAEAFSDDHFKCSYDWHVTEKIVEKCPSHVRWFTAIFSKPSEVTPAPPAVAKVSIEVILEAGSCRVSRFRGAPSQCAHAMLPHSRGTEPLPRRHIAL